MKKSKNCLKSTSNLYFFLSAEHILLVLYFTGVILNQLCSLPFFLNGAIEAEDFPRAWFLWGGDRKQAVGVANEVGWGQEA